MKLFGHFEDQKNSGGKKNAGVECVSLSMQILKDFLARNNAEIFSWT